MDLVSECIPCLVRQSLDAVRRASAAEAVRHDCLCAVLRLIADAPPQSPPVTAAAVQGLIRERTGCADPYAEDKRAANRLALALLPRLRQVVREHPHPFAAACRLAVAGNLMDLGVADHITETQVTHELEKAIGTPFDAVALASFERLAQRSRRTLWLCDNAGELVLDRLLIEQLPVGSVTVAVKGGPVLNDATIEDGLAAGLDQVADLMENGSAIPGTMLAECSTLFRRTFRDADLIVSKGQGNYETLEPGAGLPIVFLMKIKCLPVSRRTGLPLGASAILLSSMAAETASDGSGGGAGRR